MASTLEIDSVALSSATARGTFQAGAGLGFRGLGVIIGVRGLGFGDLGLGVQGLGLGLSVFWGYRSLGVLGFFFCGGGGGGGVYGRGPRLIPALY